MEVTGCGCGADDVVDSKEGWRARLGLRRQAAAAIETAAAAVGVLERPQVEPPPQPLLLRLLRLM